MLVLIGASNTRNLVQDHNFNFDRSRVIGIGGLSFQNTNDSKNLYKLLETLGPYHSYVLNHDVLNNTITPYNGIPALNFDEVMKGFERLVELGVVAVVLYKKNGAPNFLFDKEMELQSVVMTINIKNTFGNDWRQFVASNPSANATHIPLTLEYRITSHILQYKNLGDLHRINLIKHRQRKPGAGSKRRHKRFGR